MDRFMFQTPIVRGQFASPEFARFLNQFTQEAVSGSTDVTALADRVTVTENAILALQAYDVTLAGDVLNNTNNIASMQTDITQLQADVTALQVGVTALQAEQFAPVWVIPQEIDDMEPI